MNILGDKYIPENFSGTGFVEEDVVLYGALASQEADMDPIDIAFLTLRLYYSIIRLASEGII